MPSYRWATRSDMDRVISLAKHYQRGSGGKGTMAGFIEFCEKHRSGMDWEADPNENGW